MRKGAVPELQPDLEGVRKAQVAADAPASVAAESWHLLLCSGYANANPFLWRLAALFVRGLSVRQFLQSPSSDRQGSTLITPQPRPLELAPHFLQRDLMEVVVIFVGQKLLLGLPPLE